MRPVRSLVVLSLTCSALFPAGLAAAAAPAAPAGLLPLTVPSAPGPAPAVPGLAAKVACPKTLKPNKTIEESGNFYKTDGHGRPIKAQAVVLKVKDRPRSGCEAIVGHLKHNYQGGHLIAASLNGISRRYNLVPEQGNQVNQGLVKTVENRARSCVLEHGKGSVRFYTAKVTYPNATSLVPDDITITMETNIHKGKTRHFTITIQNRSISTAAYKKKKKKINTRFKHIC